MESNKHLLQDIYINLYKEINYKFSISNLEGIIIESYDKKFIGFFNEFAAKSIRTNKILIKDHFTIIPIIINNSSISLIIYNKIEDDTKIEIIKNYAYYTINKLINNQNFNIINDSDLDRFLLFIIEGNSKFYIGNESYKERCNHFNFSFDVYRRIISFEFNFKYMEFYKNLIIKIKKSLEKDEYIFVYKETYIVMFLIDNDKLYSRLLEIGKFKEVKYICISSSDKKNYNILFKESLKALVFYTTLGFSKKINYYNDITFFNGEQNENSVESLILPMKNLNKYDKELIITFINYFNFNGKIVDVATFMNVHRNTIKYRLKLIKKITGKDPENYLEMTELLTSYCAYKLTKEQNKNKLYTSFI